MTPSLLVGAFTRPIDYRRVRSINTRDEAETVQVGEHIRRWDYVVEIEDDSALPSTVLPLRSKSDDLADTVVAHLDLKPGIDGFAALVAALAEPPSSIHPSVTAFWNAVNQEPPAGVSAFAPLGANEKGRSIQECTPGEAMKRNDRSDTPSLSVGQAVFWRYSAQIFTALMHFSLAGGFSSPKLGAVMRETGYLTGNREATYKRLLETTLFVLDAMSDMSIGTGRGWKSSIRVRLLHAQVRRKIAMRKGRLNVYDQEESGIPINQQDLLAVLGSFMIAPIWSLKRTGITLTPMELSAYQKVWTHVGFYLGIDTDLLEKYYGKSFSTAEKSFAYLAFDSFATEMPADGTKTSTYAILSAVADRPPRPSTIGYGLEYSRTLLGDQLADQLAMPRGSRKDRLAVAVDCWSSYILVNFGRHYCRKGWELDRQMLFSQVIELLVVWQLGSRRTTFAWRREDLQAIKFLDDEGEAPGIEMGVAVGQSVKRKWMLLMAEIVAVVGVGAVSLIVVGAGIGWKVSSFLAARGR